MFRREAHGWVSAREADGTTAHVRVPAAPHRPLSGRRSIRWWHATARLPTLTYW